MDFCLGAEDGSATIYTADPTLDLDDDGLLDAVGLDFDGDGRLDDALADLDGDGLADHAVLDLDDDDVPETAFTDDGTGSWALGVAGAPMRWLGPDGVEHTGGPLVDFDGDGEIDDRLLDLDGDGSADMVLGREWAYVDTDGDGRWDVKLADTDGDGRADAATTG
ncbi:hypothetical protein [Mycolicibacterium thermoresistibile]|uniref:Pullulanase n=2 Tax=Mycolicibacterium thermoresistibile TaxID=1797 RepID=G7CIM1_MYCT3|nr:hypothetical protein [Mycolicibacterium thermoresistibile]EHI11350.1 hypothetical protein KEK_10663 [Mycolicibacterium thermoresistibile ATCC 19527]MCV7190475.1 pullulanase [Mycolicibacterium thermoresistibile]GAT14162.1 hypothetical protein RMCT_1133 [Mycolicibacterium thermoresistibile]SNW20836.1 pullulanase [Mycolicibacterium thermoresistibile]